MASWTVQLPPVDGEAVTGSEALGTDVTSGESADVADAGLVAGAGVAACADAALPSSTGVHSTPTAPNIRLLYNVVFSK
ncbi:hypothetical protein [Streptomyces gibsoniae]|uniref:Uncharacterized protein n=1 Tax=Streptomyces gibsoniae TaxID=3075529 RepID=A0ABU2U0N4_9ACTN|nr:hypothetical protein [Streptomyces sp. DSM 41699]MDT0466621.1 hypothetical protein [Streptomyces sp. DSM 41699]